MCSLMCACASSSVCTCMFCSVSLGCQYVRLWATTCQDVSSLGRGVVCVCLYVSLGCVKIFRLWATTRQDISSLGRGVVCLCSLGCQDVSFLSNNLSVCFVFRGGAVFVLFLYVSLGCHNLSRCFVFRQGDCACVCVCLCCFYVSLGC